MEIKHSAIAIIPSNDLDASQRFYERLGFRVTATYPHQGYRIMHDAMGAGLHLTFTVSERIVPERNAHGIYLYSEDVDALAREFGVRAEPKPWQLKEFSVSDPSGVLVRVGWPVAPAADA